MNQMTRLTQQKADAIAEKGYTVTGYVLTSPEGKKAIVDCQAVHWIDQAEPAKPVLHTQILTLRKYQAWRTGEDERTMDEAGIVPAAITSALDAVLDFAENRIAKILEKSVIPEGYALVPVEPTPEMLKSGWAENDIPLSVRWKAMINAAPEPENNA